MLRNVMFCLSTINLIVMTVAIRGSPQLLPEHNMAGPFGAQLWRKQEYYLLTEYLHELFITDHELPVFGILQVSLFDDLPHSLHNCAPRHLPTKATRRCSKSFDLRSSRFPFCNCKSTFLSVNSHKVSNLTFLTKVKFLRTGVPSSVRNCDASRVLRWADSGLQPTTPLTLSVPITSANSGDSISSSLYLFFFGLASPSPPVDFLFWTSTNHDSFLGVVFKL